MLASPDRSTRIGRRANRPARLRAHRTTRQRSPARDGSACPLPRERKKGPMHPAHTRHRRGAAGVPRRTGGRARRPRLLRAARSCARSRRRPPPRRKTRRNRRRGALFNRYQDHDPSRPAAHLCDAAPVSRPGRTLPPSRYGWATRILRQPRSACSPTWRSWNAPSPAPAAAHHTGALQAPRHTHGLPGAAPIMQNSQARIRLRQGLWAPTPHYHRRRIMRVMRNSSLASPPRPRRPGRHALLRRCRRAHPPGVAWPAPSRQQPRPAGTRSRLRHQQGHGRRVLSPRRRRRDHRRVAIDATRSPPTPSRSHSGLTERAAAVLNERVGQQSVAHANLFRATPTARYGGSALRSKASRPRRRRQALREQDPW